MKAIFLLFFVTPLAASTFFTVPQGYTKITIAGSEAVGETKLTSISASLLRENEFSGTATLGTYTDQPAPTPDTHTLSVSGVTWTSGQWTTAPYLAYLSVEDDVDNADGIPPAEEAFLITGNDSSGVLTLETSFDLATRFPAETTITIRKANTLISIFGAQSEEFNANDLIYVWDGSSWGSYFYSSSQSRFKVPGGGLGSNANDTVIYPDEGMFIARTVTDPIVLTIFGEVPSAPQIATISGQGFMACRVPVATTLVQLGIATDSWTANDLAYLWNGTSWDSFTYSTSQERWKVPGGGLLSNADDTPIAANSAVFVARSSPIQPTDAAITTKLPYTPTE